MKYPNIEAERARIGITKIELSNKIGILGRRRSVQRLCPPAERERAVNSDKIILDLCGGTGAWSHPYKKAGYDVRLVTLPEFDVRTYEPPENVYGI